MAFESPIWLLGLLPWLALVLHLLPGNAQSQSVPFLILWNATRNSPPGRSRRLPPVSILLILLSLLLAVLAAGKPAVSSKSAANRTITIILDRGASMALPSVSGKPFRGTIEKCQQQIGPLSDATHVTLITLPGKKIETTGDRWINVANSLSPTVVQTQIDQVVKNQLVENGDRVLVLSDQRLNAVDKRITQITPEPVEQCVAITSIGARPLPRPQVFLHLENHSALSTIKLRVKSGPTTVEQEAPLAALGKSTDAFVDLPALHENVMAEIESDPGHNPWARAWLARQNAGIRLIQLGQLPDAVRKIMNVYSADRPSADSSPPVVVSTSALSIEQPGIWIESTASNQVAGSIEVQAHALTRNIKQWPTVFGDHTPPEGFISIVYSGSHTVLAARESPARQIWINADFESWQNTTDFVIFFANAFDWLGGEPIYGAIDGGQPDKPWPGMYGSTAVNAGKFPTANSQPMQQSQANTPQADSHKSISPGILLAALGCLVFAVILNTPQRQIPPAL